MLAAVPAPALRSSSTARISPKPSYPRKNSLPNRRDGITGATSIWSIDTAKGEIVSEAKSVHLATAKPYGDFELWVDGLMVNHNGDSGIYPRSYPQAQIWYVDNPHQLEILRLAAAPWRPQFPGKVVDHAEGPRLTSGLGNDLRPFPTLREVVAAS